MEYTSTRNNALRVSASFAIANGISAEGGLFVPTALPQADAAFIRELCGMNYIERAQKILSLFLTDYSAEELRADAAGAYTGSFASPKTAPVVNLRDNVHILELWHGPTCAFKDMALQLLP